MKRILKQIKPPYNFYAVGDIHGQFWDLKRAIDEMADNGYPAPEFLLQVGDCEATRNEREQDYVHSPSKYRKLGDYPDVMSGELVLPPLIFIGGNHEPWQALDEHVHGMWGPNTWYLGRAGVTDVAGLRVGYLSGIHSPKVSPQEQRPTQPNRKQRTYWVEPERQTLLRVGAKRGVDVLLCHDWPDNVGVTNRGAPAGNRFVGELVERLRPALGLFGHMHHRQTARLGNTQIETLAHIRSGVEALVCFHYDGKNITKVG